MIKRRILLQVFLAVLVVALCAGASHARIIIIDDHYIIDDRHFYPGLMEEVWVVDGPGGRYGVAASSWDDCTIVLLGPRNFTVPLGPKKLAPAAGGGLLLIVILVVGGACALRKDRKVAA